MKNLRLVSISKEGTVPFPFSGNRAEMRSHNLGLLNNECASKIIFLNFRKDRRKTDFFVRCRRTYVLNKIYFFIRNLREKKGGYEKKRRNLES